MPERSDKMRLDSWEKFEEAKEGTIFEDIDGGVYIKVEQKIPYHLDGCVVRLSDGKVIHWSRVGLRQRNRRGLPRRTTQVCYNCKHWHKKEYNHCQHSRHVGVWCSRHDSPDFEYPHGSETRGQNKGGKDVKNSSS